MKNNYHIFYESLIRASAVSLANSDSYFDRMLSEGSLSLLLEEFTNKDAQSLSESRWAQLAGITKDNKR